MKVCAACESGNHRNCVDLDGDFQNRCGCRCVGVTECPTCDKDVVLFMEEDDDTAHGECCTWAWIDYWEGTFRLDLSEQS